MSQKALTSFYTVRKRPAPDDLANPKSKVPHIAEAFTKKTNSLNKDKPIETNNKQVKITSTDTVNLARKELSLGDIKKKLANSSRLNDIKARAERFTQNLQKLKEASAKKNLKSFSYIDVEVPTSPTKKPNVQNELLPKNELASPAKNNLCISPRKVIVSPAKSPSKVPIYMKHASLATSPTSLPLPYHYRFLGEFFRALETVVSLLYNRKERITFTKVKPAIQEMLKRNFKETHLAQIKNLVPDFYSFEVCKMKSFGTTNKETYELVISPNFPNDIKLMNPNVLLERRRYFFDCLLQLVKKHHAQYLQSLDINIPSDKLVRWHPEFEIEKIPEVACAKLPEIPNAEQYSTAQDVLAKARELFKCNTRMERAMEKLTQAKARGMTQEEKAITGLQDKSTSTIPMGTDPAKPSASDVVILNPALRNLPRALLELVKEKQQAKALEAMTRSSEDEKKYLIYSRLPELTKTLRNVYVTERKNVLALNVVLSKLDSTFKARVSANQLHDDINILCEQVPDFVKLHNVRNTSYLKLDRKVDLKNVVAKLKEVADKFKGSGIF